MQLTISIPTYNRNETLAYNLAYLLPQLTPQCKLVILDNCSDVPVEETLRPLLAKYPDAPCEIVRNPVNIGANANITRCLEVCETPWLWVLGDDDTPQPDAIATVLRHIAAHPNAVYINFAWDELRRATFTTRGVDEMAEKLDKSANLPWISSSVRRAEVMRAQVKFGYQYAYSLLPHVAILLMSLGERGECCFSREQIVRIERDETPIEEQWSTINLALGYPVIFDLPLRQSTRERLWRKLLLTNFGHSMNLNALLYQLVLVANQGDARGTLYFYDQIIGRGYAFERRPRERALFWAARFLFMFPQLTALGYRLVKGRSLGDQQAQNRYTRM